VGRRIDNARGGPTIGSCLPSLKSVVDMRWRLILGLLAAALTFYIIFATILGSLGMDIHWRSFH
jgi:hypothetical protein